MRPHLTEILGLPGIDVEDEAIYEDKIILSVERKAVLAICPRCGVASSQMHQNHGYFVRDLNLMHRQVILKVNRRQFKYMTCQKPLSEDLDFVGRRRQHTDRFCEMIVQQVIHSSTHSVAQQNDLTDDEVWSIVKYISKKNSTLI